MYSLEVFNPAGEKERGKPRKSEVFSALETFFEECCLYFHLLFRKGPTHVKMKASSEKKDWLNAKHKEILLSF